MTIRLKRRDYDAIVAHAKAGLPNEACGLIAGTIAGNGKNVEKVYLLTNHFTISPGEQLRAVKDMRALGLSPLGNFHSHPATRARPSAEDIRLAYNPKASYLILSLAGKEPVLRAFKIADGAAVPQAVEILP